MRRHGEMVLAGGFFVLGVLMFWYTRQFAYNGLESFGTGFWPRVIAAIMMVCSALLFVQSLLSKDPEKDEIVIDWKSEGMKRVYKVAVILVVFCVALYFIGLCLALLFMIFGIMWSMEERRIPFLVITPVGCSLFIYVVFQILLKVKLPAGILFQ